MTYDPDRDCCPDWDWRKEHAPSCFYAAETWPRVARQFISAIADWLEKKLILDGGAEADREREHQ